jgi:bifunctional ADP-heptose synthase (sugar kinase/adenylyltransferase)
LLKALGQLPVTLDFLLPDGSRNTPTYTKPLQRHRNEGWHELNRFDLRNRAPMSGDMQLRVIERLNQVWQETAGLIVLDQVNEEGWGVITPAIREHLASLARANPQKLMFVDSRAHIQKFAAGVLKPNLAECRQAVGGQRVAATDEQPANEIDGDDRAAVAELARRTGLTLYCTRGELGILIAEPAQPVVSVSGYPVSGPVDVVGAGDSATSGIVASLLAGATSTEAAVVGNLVASITVKQLGTTGTATAAQVIERWNQTRR